MWIAFNKIDLNHDGRLTLEELQSVLGEDAEEAAKMIQSVDANGDNSIDFDEFLACWEQSMEQSMENIKYTPSSSAAAASKGAEDLPPGFKQQ